MLQLWGLMEALAIPDCLLGDMGVCVGWGEVLGAQASLEEDMHSWRKEEGAWPPTLDSFEDQHNEREDQSEIRRHGSDGMTRQWEAGLGS